MNVPPSLLPLVDDGIIEEVLRPLMSGKEAQVYLVVAGGQERVAKVYKDAQHRSFKHRADYTEGRRTRNSRDQRAVARRTKHGRSQDEAAWRSTEVDMIYRLRAAGVCVPEPYIFSDGVLVMEFITDADGFAAPRLGDADLSEEAAQRVFEALIQEVIRMLCAGVVHGDLSDFNVLLGERGPVVIDFPQSMDAASNRNARNILIRDVDNLHNFLARSSRAYRPKPFAQEMWALFERGELLPDTKLRGLYRPDTKQADVGGLLREIGDARRDAVRAGLVRDEEAPGEPDRAPAPGADQHSESAARGAAPPRRRMEVMVNRGASSGDRAGPPGQGGRPGQGDRASRGERSTQARPGDRPKPARPGAPAGQGAARMPQDSRRGAQPDARSSGQAEPGRGREGREGRRRGPTPDTQALLAAQPVVTDAQRAKADQIANAAKAAQAARAARIAREKAKPVEAAPPPAEQPAQRRRRRRRGRPGDASSKPGT